MKVIVGLGNPEARYERTRHNAGFMVIDCLRARHASMEPAKARFHAATFETRIKGERCLLVKPTTYMNRSGISVGEAVRFFKCQPAEDLLVLVDELALPLGSIRSRAGGGDGGHNGLADVTRVVGDGYPRLRIGIGPRPPMISGTDFVLGRFDEREMGVLEPALEQAADAAECFVTDGITTAMNRFNTRATRESDSDNDRRPERGPIDPGWTGGSQSN